MKQYVELVIDSIMKKRKPLFLKLFYSYTALISVGIFFLVLLVNFSTNDFYNGLIRNELEDRSNNIINWMETIPLSKKSIQNIAIQSSNKKTVRITIINEKGFVIGDSHKNPIEMDNHNNRKEIIEAKNKGFALSRRFSETLKKELMYYANSKTINNQIWVVRVSIPIDDYHETISKLQKNIILLGFVAVLSLLYLSYFVSKQITAPLDIIRKQTEEYVSSNKITTPISIPKTKELASLALSLNKIATELNKRIKQINNEKQDKESLLSSMQEGILAIDKKKRIIFINEIATEYLQIESRAILNEKFTDIVKDAKINKIIKTGIKNSGKTHQIFQEEIEIMKNKKRFFLINISSLIRAGKNKGVLIVLNDITHQKQLENVRQDFVANVSHELKTPITSIVGFIEILNRNDLNKKEQNLFLKKILNHTNRMNAIIDDLLRLSKIESQEEDDTIELTKQRLFPIIEGAKDDVIENLSKNENDIIIQCDELIDIKGDSLLLREALMNLLENAGKYGAPDSLIKVIVNVEEMVFIHVENKGDEIDTKYWDKIFQRFYRIDKSRDRKAGGTGLGLAIVKHITFVHGGEIKVTLSENKTTRFTISLPLFC